MRWLDGVFLIGVLSITLLSAILLLFLPNDSTEAFLPIVKLAIGLWIVHSLFTLLGHSNW